MRRDIKSGSSPGTIVASGIGGGVRISSAVPLVVLGGTGAYMWLITTLSCKAFLPGSGSDPCWLDGLHTNYQNASDVVSEKKSHGQTCELSDGANTAECHSGKGCRTSGRLWLSHDGTIRLLVVIAERQCCCKPTSRLSPSLPRIT